MIAAIPFILKNLLPAVLKHWKMILNFAILIVSVAVMVGMCIRIATQKKTITKLEDKIEILEITNTYLSNQNIDTQKQLKEIEAFTNSWFKIQYVTNYEYSDDIKEAYKAIRDDFYKGVD